MLYARASDAMNAIEAKKRWDLARCYINTPQCALSLTHYNNNTPHSADERKERLKEAADKMREKGVSQTAFQDSKYVGA